MPIRRIFAQASAAIVSVVFAVTIQCPYASGIEFQRTHAVRDDVQVVKTHAPSSSETLFANGSRSRSFNNVASRWGAADVFLETERKDFRMSGLEERERAVELYFTTPMTTAQVVEHLGYPTRQCLERWLAMDSRYAGHMAKPIIPLETRRRAVELVPGSMQQKQAAKQLGAGVGAVHGWVRAYRKGGMAALQPKNRNSAQGNKPADSRRRPSAADDDDAEALRRRVEEPEPGERVDEGGGGGSQKKTPAPTCGACRTGRRPCRSTV